MRKKHVVFNIQQQRKNELETFSARVFEFVLHLISLAITGFAWSKLLLLHPFRRRWNHSLSRVTHDVVTKNAEVWEFWRSTKQRSLFLRLILCCDFRSRDFLWFPSAVRHLKPPSSRVTCVRDSLSCRPLEKKPSPLFGAASLRLALARCRCIVRFKVKFKFEGECTCWSHQFLSITLLFTRPNMFFADLPHKSCIAIAQGVEVGERVGIVIVLWRQRMWLYHYMYAHAYIVCGAIFSINNLMMFFRTLPAAFRSAHWRWTTSFSSKASFHAIHAGANRISSELRHNMSRVTSVYRLW